MFCKHLYFKKNLIVKSLIKPGFKLLQNENLALPVGAVSTVLNHYGIQN